MVPEGQPKTRDFLPPVAFPVSLSIIHVVLSGSFSLILKIFLYLEREMDEALVSFSLQY